MEAQEANSGREIYGVEVGPSPASFLPFVIEPSEDQRLIRTRAEFDFSANREFDKFSLRHDLSVKISFTDKLLTVQSSSVRRFQCPRLFVHQHLRDIGERGRP